MLYKLPLLLYTFSHSITILAYGPKVKLKKIWKKYLCLKKYKVIKCKSPRHLQNMYHCTSFRVLPEMNGPIRCVHFLILPIFSFLVNNTLCCCRLCAAWRAGIRAIFGSTAFNFVSFSLNGRWAERTSHNYEAFGMQLGFTIHLFLAAPTKNGTGQPK